MAERCQYNLNYPATLLICNRPTAVTPYQKSTGEYGGWLMNGSPRCFEHLLGVNDG